ncbi:kelch domain-containing protein 4 [Drosophila grimshawi]|uniref:GH24829 n=1 Tax=Drosophila grimshawi TaxID=7222 RepID=B4JNJ3_DROGR|nr:kelch domain-containing protein 4 [Drosophila grimshawi]EDV92286.1 GH24829 [Drosophila grimshawi]
MGKKDKNKKKGKGAEKTAMKTDKKLAAKQKKMLEKLGETDIAEIVKNLEEQEKNLKAISEDVCPAPTARSNFSLVAHPEKEELIMFGGELYNGAKVSIYNDLFFYNIPRNEWKQLRSPSGPTPRSGHQMVTVATDGGQLWMFGGEHASPSQLQFYHYKDLWTMSLRTRQWSKIAAPHGPSARSGHRMVAAKKRLFVFGGFHDNNQSYHYYNDVHVFSLESYEWLQIEIGGTIAPPVRSGCCMAATPDGKIFVWGGYSRTSMKKDLDRGITHTDMFQLDVDKSGNGNKYKWSSVKAGGYRPKPRNSVGCTVAANGKAYCFGGVMDVNEDDENVQGQFGDELLSFDLTTQVWRLLEVVAKTKSSAKKDNDMEMAGDAAAADPTATVSEKSVTTSTDGIFTVTVGGPGSSSATTTPYVSTIPSLFGPARRTDVPAPRMNPGLCVCKGILYLFGGLYEEDEKQQTLNDFYALDLHKLDQWKVLIPGNRKAHDWIDDSENSSSDEEGSDEEDDDDDDSDSDMDTD